MIFRSNEPTAAHGRWSRDRHFWHQGIAADRRAKKRTVDGLTEIANTIAGWMFEQNLNMAEQLAIVIFLSASIVANYSGLLQTKVAESFLHSHHEVRGVMVATMKLHDPRDN